MNRRAAPTNLNPPPPRTSGEGRLMRTAPLGRLSSLLLPALALAAVVGLLWLTPADSARAQEKATVWSATLTVSGSGNSFGCDLNAQGINNCSDQLSDDDFTYKGTTYTVKQAEWRSDLDQLFIWFDDGGSKSGEEIKKALRKLTLNVDGTELKVTNAGTSTGGPIYLDYEPSSDWVVGQTVSLSLTGGVRRSGAPSVWVESVDYASSPPNGTHYRHGETMAVAVNFSGPVKALSKDMWLRIELNDQTADLWLHSGGGTDQWIFAEVVDEVLHGNDTDGFSVIENPNGSWVGMTAKTANKYGATVSFKLNGKINKQYQSRHQVKGGEKVPAPAQVTSVTCNASGDHCTVPYNWKYAPKSLKKQPGASFRLMYVTSSDIAGSFDNISEYNDLAQRAVPDGGAFHNFSTSIRAMANALNGENLKANTRTRLNSGDQRADPGAWDPIFWVKGKKVADNYTDLYDGSWDSRKATNESGDKYSGSHLNVWTGSEHDGSPAKDRRLGEDFPNYGNALSKSGALHSGSRPESNLLRVYAITPLLTVGSK